MNWFPAYFLIATAFFQVFEYSLLGTIVEIAVNKLKYSKTFRGRGLSSDRLAVHFPFKTKVKKLILEKTDDQEKYRESPKNGMPKKNEVTHIQ